MKIIDISLKLDENAAVYEGDPRFSSEVWKNVQDDGFMLSTLRMGTHTGTHLDAPCHFISDGKTVAEISPRRCLGKCAVVDEIDAFAGGYSRVLISSRKKGGRITLAQAQRLIDLKVRLIGTERLSIGNDEVHRYLLGNDCVILEALDLSAAPEGEYILSALPLKIEADGCPVRAVLMVAEA